MLDQIILESGRALEPIDRILTAVINFCYYLLPTGGGFFSMVVNTITNSPFLLISVSLVVCGAVIGLLKRLITL